MLGRFDKKLQYMFLCGVMVMKLHPKVLSIIGVEKKWGTFVKF